MPTRHVPGLQHLDTPPGGSQEDESLRDLVRRLLHAATHDSLTGLPNRSVLLERLEYELARTPDDATGIAVLFVDLDNFKLVNDSLGHGSGDIVLREMAHRISACVEDVGTVSRFGGDELVVLHPRAGADAGTTLGARIMAVIAEPLTVAGREVVVSASVGVAHCTPGTKSSDQLLREADTALYAAKGRGRGRLQLFNEELHTQIARRVQIESDLRVALREAQIRVIYQPQVNLNTGYIVGTEALARWHHPQRGVISPADFIPVAEDCGLIVALGRQVLSQACRQLAQWSSPGSGRSLSMTVNLSPRQLEDPGFADELTQILADTGIDSTALCLELTEGALMSATEDTVAVLSAIRRMGVYIAIDDFGTQHSSLARLRDLPAEVLKIDRSFIDGLGSEPGDTAIVSSILSLACAMGKHVIAEGVENADQAGLLQQMGCEVAQGYLLSRPLPPEQIPPLLDARLWQPPVKQNLRAGMIARKARARSGSRYFIDEFLFQIGAPMNPESATDRRKADRRL